MDTTVVRTQRENEDRVAEEYLSSLSDLNCNSKPLINMLTMLAEENIEYAPVIVKVVEQHMAKVPPDYKLPILYLIDSIVKNVKSTYVQLFSQCIVNIFCDVFEQVNEKTRERMYALRQTWVEVFSSQKLYSLDVRVKRLDQNWPITARPPSIHVNPNFLKTVNAAQAIPAEVGKILQDKTRELLELKKIKLELELEATKKHLEQEKQLSKVVEGIVPPVEALVAANALQTAAAAGLPPHALPPQLLPGMMPTNYMPPAPHPSPMTMRPGMYPNIRNFRPHLHPPMMNVHRQTLPPSTMNSTVPNTGGVVGGMSSKPRVLPVNAAMVSVMRQRDPRLARQLQQTSQQNLQQQQQQPEKHANEMNKISADADKSLDKTKNERSSKSSHKSPSRTSAASNSSNSRSLGRSGKHSTRDKEKNRSKRSESKSSTTSSSSAGSNVSTERKRSAASNDKGNKSAGSSTSASCDKDAFEIAPLSMALKHKSLSPAASPNKLRDNNKRSSSQKTHNHTRNKNMSRSPSPKKEHFHDIDLRQVAPMASVVSSVPVSTSAGISSEKKPKLELNNEDLTALGQVSAKNLDKNFKPLIELPVTESRACNHMDVDLRPQFVAPAATVASTSSSHFDSIKYKLLPSVSKAATITIDLTTDTKATSSSPKVSFKIEKLVNKLEKSSENLTATTTKLEQQHHGVDAKQLSGHVSNVKDEDDIKKRSSDAAMIKSEEPLAKKSKSTQLEELFGSPELFGSEDVDLRQLMPVMPVNCKPAEDKTPPPPRIKEDQPMNRSDNWDNFKGDSSKVSPKKSSLDDVRAKLAKTAKLSKLSKTAEKNNKELTHRLRLAELQNLNEDTQEANDDKIRTMISQAQELLESKSITKEQHTNLLQTVMSINEANKLKIAKRQESLNAAREAVLKKRIPKLNKTQTNANDQQTSSKAEDSPRYDDKPDSNDGQVAVRGRSGNRDKRFPKVTKWSDRVAESATNSNSTSSIMPVVRPWVRGMLNNRPFRGVGPPHATMNPNMRLQWPQAPFPNGGAGVGNSSPLLHIRNIPPMPHQPQAPVIHKPCNSIDNPQEDLVRTIIIDGVAREIRFYDKLAIVFMEVDQPHEIGFQNGQRTICIDNKETIVLHFNEGYKPVTIDGETLHMRFGFPSRELYIDEHWYEIYFGGPPVTLPIRSKMHMLKAEGPPPQVNIGTLRRDLVVGKINMIIDAQNVIPLFLDARTQIFHLDDMEHTIQFADNLLTVLLDGAPTRVEYGGLPKSFLLKGKKYFVRFSGLPQGVVPGKVQIKDMIYVDTQPSTAAQQQSPMETDHLIDLTESLDAKVLEKDSISGIPTTTEANATTTTAVTATNQSSAPTTNALSNINIDELFQKLVSSGILNGSNNILPTATKLNSNDDTSEEEESIKPIDLTKPESIRKRQSAIVNVLFAGMPCSMCGIRFPQTNKQTNKYSQHLNWHYRQKRRERDMSRKARSRKWYFELNDWVQYEEVEDEDERLSKNFFESQKHDLDATDETSNQRSLQSPLPSCPAGPADVVICDMCHEKFEQVYNHESEEWQLPGAIRVDDKIYHPLCYEDYKTSLNPPKPDAAAAAAEEEEEHKNNEIITIDSTLIQIDDDNAVDIEIKLNQGKEGGKSTKDEEDDDDVIVLPNEEPSVTEIVDDDEEEEKVGQVEPEKTTTDKVGIPNKEDATILNETPESDVEIEEPLIPFTDLDTYEEKEPTVDEDSTQMSFMNVKIKEEPKIDEDEDDGFEDVGTVLIVPEEISIQSSEGTQTHISGTAERPGSPASSVHNEDDVVEVQTAPSQDLNTSMDGNLESGNEHNLSSVGPAPTMPLVSLINKIKINITKNTVSNNNTASNSNNSTSTTANSSSTATATGHSTTAIVSGSNEQAKGSSVAPSSNPIPTISTIPVLCSGGTTIPSIMSSGDNNTLVGSNSVSTISVIGTSYGGGCANTKATITTVASKTESIQSNQPTPPTPVAVEEEIQYELKPALQKITFKKKEKVVCGSETSGLCSIM